MRWDSHNPLAEMSGGGVSEGYVYEENGQRLRKTNLLPPNNTTSYFFPNYERTSGGSTAVKHYSFGGTVVAVRTGGGSFSFLCQDGVNSTVYITDLSGAVTSARGYRVFGGARKSEGAADLTASQSPSAGWHPARRRLPQAG